MITTVKRIFIAALATLAISGSASAAIDESHDVEHLRLINVTRAAEYGGAPLKMSDALNRAARIRAAELAQKLDAAGHTRPDGSSFSTVLTEVAPDFAFGKYAENIAAGQKNAAELMGSWGMSPTQRQNILYSGYRYVGLATYRTEGGPSSSGHNIFWVQLFAVDAPDSALYDPTAQREKVLYGDGQVWRQGGGEEGITAVFAAPFADYKGVMIDGRDADPANIYVDAAETGAYSVPATKVRINRVFLNGTSAGEHSLVLITSSDYGLSTTFATYNDTIDYSSNTSKISGPWRRGGTTPLSTTVSGIALDRLVLVECERAALARGADYTVSSAQSGSFEINFSSSFMDRLTDGEHDIKVCFADGSAVVKLKVEPKDGGKDVNSGGGSSGCSVGSAALAIALIVLASKIRR